MKLFKVLFIGVAFIIIASILESCCEDRFKINGLGSIEIYHTIDESIMPTDTISGPFLLVDYLTVDVVAGLHLEVVQRCYGFTCERKYENNIDRSSIKISCNRPFVYQNDTIDTWSDFSWIETLVITAEPNSEFFQIEFPQEFISQANFENGKIKFQIEAKTTDDISIQDEKLIHLNF